MLVRRVGPVEGLDRLVRGSVSERLAEAARLRLTDATDARVLARSLLGDADRLGARVVTPEDDEWPRQLDDLVRLSRAADGRAVERDTDPPHCLWVRGDVALDEAFDRSVAVIGARAASNYGTYVATEMAHGLAERGWTVVSGGAYGIDAAAHRAALAAGGLTAAILASGLDRPYPLGHANLFDRIGESGLLVSEWPFGSAPHRMRFLIRNRVIAAATRGTVVVEAAGRSGARQTLGRARALGRAAMAVPGPVTSAMSVGCHAELRQEGTRLVNDHGEVIEEVGRIGDDLAPTPRGPERPHDTLDPLAAQLLDAVLPRKARTAEEVAAAAGVSGRDARRTLPTLVAAGFVVEHDNGYRLAPTPP
ncbi:DNA-protecting protein DprA [Planosporangium mesophilum]|nr:DNA-protecting protein DprA [Planosporangium mesophilum]